MYKWECVEGGPSTTIPDKDDGGTTTIGCDTAGDEKDDEDGCCNCDCGSGSGLLSEMLTDIRWGGAREGRDTDE